MDINSLIKRYVDDNIKPKKDENDIISKRYNEIKELLLEHGYYCFRSGSYARGTAIHPVNDLDIICECDESDVEDFKNSEKGKGLYKILSEKYDEDNIDFQSSSIGISFGEDENDFGIDVVISVKRSDVNNYGDNLYDVPKILYKTRSQRKAIYKNISENGEGKEYLDLIKSDPKGYKKEMKELKDKNDNVIYVTRFLKKWKSVIKGAFYLDDSEKFLKSFHIEEVVKRTIKSNLDIGTLGLLLGALKEFDLTNANIPDRADESIMIDSYVDEDDFNKAKALQQLCNLMEDCSNISAENFNDTIDKIFLIKKEVKKIKIDNKQKSYYAING